MHKKEYALAYFSAERGRLLHFPLLASQASHEAFNYSQEAIYYEYLSSRVVSTARLHLKMIT